MSLYNPVELCIKLVNGDLDPCVLRWLKDGSAAFLRSGGTVLLERCLGLPAAQGLRLAQRNSWLIQAAKVVPNASSLAREYYTRF